MDKETTAAFDRRAMLISGLNSGTLLVDAAYQQFKLDYAAAQRPISSVVLLAVTGEAPLDGPPSDRTPQPTAAPTETLHFELSFANRVRLTSTRFAGGDWNWRLCTASGTAIARGGGYRTEGECRSAIALVQRAAGQAPIKDR
jgi:uncharacterized protein YegP (UPF0339 family)